jgi:hypothetical protein
LSARVVPLRHDAQEPIRSVVNPFHLCLISFIVSVLVFIRWEQIYDT